MPTLYDINAELQNLLEVGFDEECIDQDTGEILEQAVAAKIAALQLKESDKKESVALYIKNLTAESKALKEEGSLAGKAKEQGKESRLPQSLFVRHHDEQRGKKV